VTERAAPDGLPTPGPLLGPLHPQTGSRIPITTPFDSCLEHIASGTLSHYPSRKGGTLSFDNPLLNPELKFHRTTAELQRRFELENPGKKNPTYDGRRCLRKAATFQEETFRSLSAIALSLVVAGDLVPPIWVERINACIATKDFYTTFDFRTPSSAFVEAC